jgi:hypothetical protein
MEVRLPPVAIAELLALREMRKSDVCSPCRKSNARVFLKRDCVICGKQFNDQETEHYLTVS